jgi:hypothetical protein
MEIRMTKDEVESIVRMHIEKSYSAEVTEIRLEAYGAGACARVDSGLRRNEQCQLELQEEGPVAS